MGPSPALSKSAKTHVDISVAFLLIFSSEMATSGMAVADHDLISF